MNLFDAAGVILIAVDDKFTLEDPDGIEVNNGSIHRQFLNRYYTKESGYKAAIKTAVDVAKRGNADEFHVTIGDKIFVLFSYTTQGNRKDYASDMDYRRGLVEIEDSIKKVFQYCKENFSDKVVHTALIGTGIQNDRSPNTGHGYINPLDNTKYRLLSVAEAVGISIEIVEIDDEPVPMMGD